MENKHLNILDYMILKRYNQSESVQSLMLHTSDRKIPKDGRLSILPDDYDEEDPKARCLLRGAAVS